MSAAEMFKTFLKKIFLLLFIFKGASQVVNRAPSHLCNGNIELFI